MPRATVSREGIRKELETLPEGYVLLRKLSYGEIQERKELASSLRAGGAPNRAQRRGAPSDDGELRVDVHYKTIQLFDFQRCILEHNLEDDNGNVLSLGTMEDMVKLDPRVGQEIEALIDDLNNFEGGPKSEGEGRADTTVGAASS